MKKFSLVLAVASITLLSACGPKPEPVAPGPHNLSVDEARRAQINAEAYFATEFPAGTNKDGNLVKKKGSFTQCRPQDSNDNGLVTCTGMRPDPMTGAYAVATMYCGYGSGASAVVGCNDKDQK